MASERWQRIEHFWSLYLDLSPSEREAVLDSLRREQPRAAEHLEGLPVTSGIPESLESGEFPTSALEVVVEEIEKQSGQRTVGEATKPEQDTLARKDGARSTHRAGPLEFVGNYRIEHKIGQGGMGVVYKGHHEQLDRTVAIKMIRAGSLANDNDLARFLVEARSIAALQHPNIVQIYEIGEHEGNPYFSLEYVEGGSLAQRLKVKPFSPREAAAMIETLARATHVAHQHGIVHRDLKPGNILLTPDCQPKITDFGLAKELHGSGEGRELTLSGAVMGTPAYMAPEQARGDIENIGPSVDVYALGGILFEMLTGEPPFRGESMMAVLRQVEHKEPTSPSTLAPNVHRDLCTICLKCLRKRTPDRYASAEELANDLRRFLDGEPIQARPVGRAEKFWLWCQRNPTLALLSMVTALAFVVLVIGGGIVWNVTTISNANAKAREEAEKAAQAQRRLAATQEYHANFNKARQRIEQGEPGWIAPSLADIAVSARAETPDRDPVELRTEAARCFSGVDFGQQKVALQGFVAYAVAVSPTGELAALGQRRAPGWVLPCAVRVISTKTGEVVRDLTFPPDVLWSSKSELADGVTAMAYSPDGRYLAICSYSGWVRVWDLSQKESTPFRSWKPKSSKEGRTAQVVFSTDSRRVYSTFIWDFLVFGFDLASEKTPPVRYQSRRIVTELAFDPKGRWLAVSGDGVALLDPVKLTLKRMVGAGRITAFDIHPNGESLVVSEQDPARGNSIHLVDVETGEKIRTYRSPESNFIRVSNLTKLKFNTDGSLLATLASIDRSTVLDLWETASGEPLSSYVSKSVVLEDFAFTQSPAELITVEAKRTVIHQLVGLREQTFAAHHAEPIHDFTFSPHGKYVGCLTGHSLTVTHFETDRRRHRVAVETNLGHISSHNALTFDPSGTSLLASINTEEVASLDLTNPERPRRWPWHKVFGFGFAPKSGTLWLAGGREFLTQRMNWPAADHLDGWPRPATEVVGGPREVRALSVGSRVTVGGGVAGVIYGGVAGKAYLFENGSAKPSISVDSPGGLVFSTALSPDETVAAIGTHEGKVRLIETTTGKTLQDFADHRRAVRSLDFSPDGTLLATASDDGTVRLYVKKTEKFEPLMTLRPRTAGPVKKIEFHPNGRILGMLCRKETAVRLWHLDRVRARFEKMNLGARALPTSSKPTPVSISAVTLEEAEDKAAAALANGDFDMFGLYAVRAHRLGTVAPRLWPGLARWKRKSTPTHRLKLTGRIEQVLVRPGTNELLALGDQSHWIDLESGKTLDKPTPDHGGKYIAAGSFTKDGKLLMTGGKDGYARMWDAETVELRKAFLHRKDEAVRVATLRPSGGWFITGGDDSWWKIRAVADGATTLGGWFRVGDVAQIPTSIVYSPDEKYLFSGGTKGYACIHHGSHRDELLGTSEKHPAAITHVRGDPRGGTFGSLDRKGVVRIFEVPSCRLLRTIDLGAPGFGCLTYHPTGGILAVSTKGVLWLIDADRGRVLRRFDELASEVWALTFTPDGKTLVAGSEDGTLTTWDVSTSALFDLEKMRLEVELDHGVSWTDDGKPRRLTLTEIAERKRRVLGFRSEVE